MFFILVIVCVVSVLIGAIAYSRYDTDSTVANETIVIICALIFIFSFSAILSNT